MQYKEPWSLHGKYKQKHWWRLWNYNNFYRSRIFEKNYSEYNIILLSDNIAESYNQAINKCNSDWIVFLDDDAIVTPNWLKNMYKITKFDNTGAIGPLTNNVIGQALDFDFSTRNRNK